MRRVLVVEDERDIRDALAQLLASEGYEVSEAANGLEALRAARADHPDLILLDLMMPVMTGWEFRRAQVQDPSIATIPVVVVSAVARTSGVDAAGYIGKPFDLEDVLDAVGRFAPSRGPAGDPHASA